MGGGDPLLLSAPGVGERRGGGRVSGWGVECASLEGVKGSVDDVERPFPGCRRVLKGEEYPE